MRVGGNGCVFHLCRLGAGIACKWFIQNDTIIIFCLVKSLKKPVFCMDVEVKIPFSPLYQNCLLLSIHYKGWRKRKKNGCCVFVFNKSKGGFNVY